MIIEVELDAQTQALLASQAAARNMELRTYAASLLERVAAETVPASVPDRPAGRKSLAQLFAESPFKGLDVDFERDPDQGRDLAL
ncbi:MAG: hypothetical protein WBD32_05130 [Acidobacteriaceae bacterium]